MAFIPIHLLNLTELKSRRGNSTDTTLATIIGLNYPPDEAFAIYIWNNTSVETADDNEIVQPTIGGITTGRWYRVDLGITSALVIAALGYEPYDALNPDDFITVTQADLAYEPIFTKNTAFNKNFGTTTGTVAEGNDTRIVNGATAFSWGNHASAGYITANSVNTLTNKSGNISQWTNDSGYLTSIAPQSFASLTGKPTTISGYGITDFNSLGDARWSSLGHTHTFASLTSKPTTLSGYGITDAYLSSNPNSYINQAGARTAISLTTTGTGISSYNNSTGVLNIPTPKVPERFQVTTIAGGTATVTYANTYTVPNVQFNIVGGDPRDTVRITTNNTTGCTVTVQRRVDALGLLPTYNTVVGAVVNIWVLET